MSSTPRLRGSGGPTVANRYLIQERLGAGGLGSVYLARDQRTNRSVALKVLRTDRMTRETVERLREEFSAFASLQHPQIAAAYDFGYTRDEQVPYYTREYIQGTPLAAGPPGNTTPDRFLAPIFDLLEALEYLHTHGLLHLDVHAGNLIVADDARRGSVLIDFGLVRSPPTASASAGWSLTGLPPELLRAGRAAPTTDVYMAGRLLQYRLTERTDGDPKLPREFPGWGVRLTLELERIISKAISRAPAMRFRSAAEFRAALTGALGAVDSRRRSSPAEARELTVGRARELKAIDRALESAGSGERVTLAFVGARGCGKSRLLLEAKLRSQLAGLDIVETRFFPDPGPGSALVRSLKTVTGGEFEDAWLDALAPSRGGTPKERAERAAQEFFAVGGLPVVLLVDDVDLADAESRALTEALIAVASRQRSGARGLAMFLTSTEQVASGLGTIHALRPLRRRDSRRLFRLLVRPLSVPENVLSDAVARCDGSPLRLRSLARMVKDEWRSCGTVPRTAELPQASMRAATRVLPQWASGSLERDIAGVLETVRRPLSVAEIAAALGVGRPAVSLALRRLRDADAVVSRRYGRGRIYQLNRTHEDERLADPPSAREKRRFHERLVEWLTGRLDREPLLREHLARHVLAMRQRQRGFEYAIDAAETLRARGFHQRAVRLLEDALGARPGRPWRLRLCEKVSSLLGETGDHTRAIAFLEPFCRGSGERLARRKLVRLQRCLGVHYHRAGFATKALAAFEAARDLANPRREVADLVFIDSELAEIYTVRGRYDDAEEACRRGLARLRTLRERAPFADAMEVTLRASLGHLELRRLSFARARVELQAAARLASRCPSTSIRAIRPAILNNLGIVENQLNRFSAARRHFAAAERLLVSSGDRRTLITISCNLAVIGAKLGEPAAARDRLERAIRMLYTHPGRESQFAVEYCRGVVCHLLGDSAGAVEAFETALPRGRKLGDDHLVRFGEVYLAEAELARGRYARAVTQLRATAEAAAAEGVLLRRMVHSRLFFVETVLTRRRAARRSLRILEETERTPVDLLEAWNDLFVGLARTVSGDGATRVLEGAARVFRRLRVPFGEGLASTALLLEALTRDDGDGEEIERRLRQTSDLAAGNALLDVASAVARGEAFLRLGRKEESGECVSRASASIVGSLLPELDLQIELFRARMAVRDGDVPAARRHLHRSIHTRELLVQYVPRAVRKRFLQAPRFRALDELEERLERSPRLAFSTRKLRRAASFEGMIGKSEPMIRVFETLHRLRDQDVSVLIRGETGTGKELVARALHRTSPRANGPFLAVHCATLAEELFEAEFFGHAAGAFTDADEARPGLLAGLAGGTLLLDEINQLPPGGQAKLLRVLESRAVRPLGSTTERTIDVRFLASTSTDLRALAKAKGFRADLLYRLQALEIVLPPLRRRHGDVPVLARHFLECHAQRLGRTVPRFSEAAARRLEAHDWPGNVRELETLVVRALVSVSAGTDVIERLDIEPCLAVETGERLLDFLGEKSLPELKRDLERAYLARLFRETGGDLQAMMKAIGVGRSRLYTLLRRAGLEVAELRRTL